MPKPIYLHRKDIDTELWDRRIAASIERKIYAYSWWLDAVTDYEWSAIVDSNEYNVVMPIPLKKRAWIIKIVFRPFLSQQLGIFSNVPVDLAIEKSFFQVLKSRCHILKWTIHKGHILDGKSISTLTNHILKLSSPSDYNRLTKRNIKVANDFGYQYFVSQDCSDFIEFIIENMPYKLNSNEVRQCENLIKAAGDRQLLDFWISNEGQSNASCKGLCIRDIDKVYFVLVASNGIGKEHYHAFALIDDMISHYRKLGIKTFDFTGSNIESIARRNLGFGAEKEEYFKQEMLFWSK
jgi:hypothetical protein